MKKQILYIDGDIASYILVSEILSDYNVEITHCRNGLNAIKLFRLYPLFDLVITEMRLPRADGFTILNEIHQIKPDIPVIAQTASVWGNMEKQCLEAGFNEFIPKPIDIGYFVSVVKMCIHKKILKESGCV
jgi:CheY-like chemotaxis protein